MANKKNGFFTYLILFIIWLIHPITYEEVVRRNHISPKENVVVVKNFASFNSNDELSFLEGTKKDIILADSSSSVFVNGFPNPFPNRPRRQTPMGMGGSNPGGNGNGNGGSSSVPNSGNFTAPSEGQFKKAIVSRIKESPALVREAEIMGKNQKTQIEANHLINQLSLGNRNPGTGSKSLKGCRNVSYLRGDKEARIFYRETKEGIEILGKANKKNEQKVIDILRTMYN